MRCGRICVDRRRATPKPDGARAPFTADNAPAMTDFIETYDDALTPALCQQLIAMFEASPHRVRGRTGAGVDESKKVSTDLYLDQHPEWRDVLSQVQAITAQCAERYFEKYRFALIAPVALTVRHPETGTPTALTDANWAEVGRPQVATLMRGLYRLGPIQMQKYDVGAGNYNYWHCEVYPDSHPSQETLHRTLLFMFYLNDVAEGGHTEFFYQQRRLQPKAGQMVIAPGHFTHTHRGCVPTSGDKYILTSWILMQRSEQLYGPR